MARRRLAAGATLVGLASVLAVAVIWTTLAGPSRPAAVDGSTRSGAASATSLAAPTPTARPSVGPTATASPRRAGAAPSISARTPRAPAPPPPGAAPRSGWPSSDNTGWRHLGVTLRPYSGPDTITRDGTVIDRADITRCLWVQAENVTIKRSRIRCSDYFVVRVEGGASAVIEDTEIDGKGRTDGICVSDQNYTALRVDCHSVGDGLRVGSNVHVEDSYVHDLATCGDCHNDGMQAVGAVNVIIRHNTVENQYSQTSAIILGNEFGELRNIVVDGNLLSGGGYTLYGGGSDSNVSGIKVTNNRFRRLPNGFFRNGGSYGPVAYFDTGRPGNVWSGNVWDDNGAVVAPEM